MKGAILPDTIELVALDPARNIRRRYSITAIGILTGNAAQGAAFALGRF